MRYAALLLTIAVTGCGSPPTDQQMWSAPWTEPTSEVMRILARNQAKGCGEFYQKENSTSKGDFAVACSAMPDGSGLPGWVGYEVFVPQEDVLGPDYTAVFQKFGGPPRELTKDDIPKSIR